MPNSPLQAVSMDQVKDLVGDLRDAKPAIYLSDLLLSACAGWALFAYALMGTGWAGRLLAFAGAALLLFRALAFIHEIFHQQAMTGFRLLWHVLVGVPLLIPFLLYLPIHQAHHNAKTYGTPQDGEYEQFLGRCRAMSIKLYALNVALPLALLLRFALLTPLSLVFPKVRQELIPNFVHMALRMPYRAPDIKESARPEAMRVELGCAAFGWGLIALALSGHGALLSWWGALVIAIATLNTVRALCATHLYVEQAGGRGARGQMLDSLNIDNAGLLTQLLCPVGLRFHALHHVAPYLPYHALAEAHRRLMAALPAGSEYHWVSVPSLGAGLRRLSEATEGTG